MHQRLKLGVTLSPKTGLGRNSSFLVFWVFPCFSNPSIETRGYCSMLGLKVGHSRKYFPQLFYYTPPENWHDNETTTIKKDVSVSLFSKGDFPASHVSFLKNNCNHYAQLKRHYGTAPCRSSTTKTKQLYLLGAAGHTSLSASQVGGQKTTWQSLTPGV